MEKTHIGKIAVGWLVVEDLVMVIALVVIPPLAGLLGGISVPLEDGAQQAVALGIGPIAAVLLVTALNVSAFLALMLVVGRKVIPSIVHYTAHNGSRELFRLSVLSIALGMALGSAYFVGVSFALGAFFAGMVMAVSSLGCSIPDVRIDERRLPLFIARATLRELIAGLQARATGETAR